MWPNIFGIQYYFSRTIKETLLQTLCRSPFKGKKKKNISSGTMLYDSFLGSVVRKKYDNFSRSGHCRPQKFLQNLRLHFLVYQELGENFSEYLC